MSIEQDIFNTHKPLKELIEDFQFLDDWEDRYAYLIDLGKQLVPLPDHLKVDEHKVRGCTSQVWLVHQKTQDSKHGEIHNFAADSDAFIVRGLVAIVLSAYSGKSSESIANIDLGAIFSHIGLEKNLSVSRRNGFASMIAKVKAAATQ